MLKLQMKKLQIWFNITFLVLAKSSDYFADFMENSNFTPEVIQNIWYEEGNWSFEFEIFRKSEDFFATKKKYNFESNLQLFYIGSFCRKKDHLIQTFFIKY